MPRLTPSGRLVSGLGRVPLNESEVIGQEQIGRTWRICIDGIPVSDRGCSMIAAAAGHWRAYLAGYGVFGPNDVPVERHQALAGDIQQGRGASAPDGTIGIVLNQQQGRGLRLLAPDGGKVDIDTPLTSDVFVVARDKALWINNGVRVFNLPQPVTLPGPVGWPQVLRLNNEWWIAYHSTDANGIVCHPFTSLFGYRIAKVPAFYLHAIAIAGNVARFAWALDSAETHNRTRDVDVNTDARVNLVSMIPEPEPDPMPDPLKLLAPNIKHLVERAMREHPEIVTKGTAGEKGRGAILDYAIGYAEAEGDTRWYRKARNKDGTNLNTDALVYLRPDNRIEIYDAIGGGSGKATWTKPTKTLAIGENGYPVKPKAPEPEPEPGPGEPVPIPDVPSNIELRLQAIEREVKALREQPQQVSIRAKNTGQVVRNSLDGPVSVLQADRPGVGGEGEVFIIERIP